MTRYLLHLHDGPATVPVREILDMNSDADARDMAQITLLSTPACTHAHLYRESDLIGTFERDSYAG